MREKGPSTDDQCSHGDVNQNRSKRSQVLHACNPKAQEAEAGGSQRVRGQPELQSQMRPKNGGKKIKKQMVPGPWPQASRIPAPVGSWEAGPVRGRLQWGPGSWRRKQSAPGWPVSPAGGGSAAGVPRGGARREPHEQLHPACSRRPTPPGPAPATPAAAASPADAGRREGKGGSAFKGRGHMLRPLWPLALATVGGVQ